MNEIRSLLKKVVIAIIVLLWLGSMPVLQTGSRVYKDHLLSCKKFEQIEKKIAKKNFESIDRGLTGKYIFSFMGQPSPVLILFYNSISFNSLQAYIDGTGVNLKNYSPIGSYNCERSYRFKIDFFLYLVITSIFLVPMFGFFCHPNRKYFLTSLNFQSSRSSYWSSFWAKFIIILAAMIVLLAIVFIMIALNGIRLNISEVFTIMFFFLIILIFQLILLVSATLARFLKRRTLSTIVIILIWVGSLFLFSCVIPNLSNNTDDSFKSEELNFKKNDSYMYYENFAFNKILKTEESERVKIKRELSITLLEKLRSFRDSEVRLIEKLESDINRNNLLTIFHPIPFIWGCGCEMGSLGYNAFIELYNEVSSRQYEIAVMYYKKVLVKETYIQDTNNSFFSPIIKLKSSLPKYFFTGLLFNTAILIVFLILAYFPFKRSLSPLVKKSFKNLKLSFKKGEYVLLYIKEGFEDFADKLYNVVFNKSEKFDGEITIDGEPLADKKVFYLPELSDEDIEPLALLSGGTIPAKPFKEYNFKDICELFPQVRQCDVLLLDNVSIKLEPQKGITIIDMNPEIVDRKHTRLFRLMREEAGYTLKREHKKE